MNCKQGDIARVFKGPNTGMIVTCLEYLGSLGWDDDNNPLKHVWRTDKPMKWFSRSKQCQVMVCEAPDSYLMPLSGYEPCIYCASHEDELNKLKESAVRPMAKEERDLMELALWNSVEIVHKGRLIE